MQAVKDRLAQLAQMPGQAADQLRARLSAGSPIAPNNRPGVPQEGLPASAPMSPEQEAAQKQAIMQALMQRQQQEQLQQQIQQGQRQQPTPQNPAGIQF